MKRISIHIANKDRHAELALLLQSLRTQTFQDWDLVILDGNETPIMNNHFLIKLIDRIKLENHYVALFREELRLGVCHARQELIDKDYFDNDYICRLDDDVILEKDYLQKLLDVINFGYDIASGVTPLIGVPEFIRKVEFVEPIINRKDFDKENNLVYYGDDCGYCYDEEAILSAHEFRSCALMKKEVIKKIKYETNLSSVGFREEGFFSIRALLAGFTIGINTQAIAWHLIAQTGGVRIDDYANKINSDNEYFYRWIKRMITENGKLP